MTDAINKFVLVILAVLVLIVAPLTMSYVKSEEVTERLVLNEVTQFIDKCTDKGSVTDTDLDDLYLGVNATGGVYNVTVRRFVRVATEDETGKVRSLYFSNDDLTVLNVGDVVQVHVEELTLSPAKRLLWAVLRIDEGKFEFTLAGTVR